MLSLARIYAQVVPRTAVVPVPLSVLLYVALLVPVRVIVEMEPALIIVVQEIVALIIAQEIPVSISVYKVPVV